jgi:hypothetical protein
MTPDQLKSLESVLRTAADGIAAVAKPKPKWVLREYPARNGTGYCVDRGAYDKWQTIYVGGEFALSKQQAEAIAKALNELEEK